jgi:sugar transferase (PEP-CTERM/EpsH1 system associated)
MRIYYVCQRVPYPPNRGDKIATYNQIKHLARRHEVHVFCVAQDRDDGANASGLAGIAKSVTAIPVSTARARLRALKALVTDGPLSTAYLDEPALHAAVAKAVAAAPPDLILVYSSNVAQFVERFVDVPRIMYFSDLDSQKWAQYASHGRAPMRWLYALEARRLLAFEARIAHSFSHSVVSTPTELKDFERLIPGAPVSAVRNGVDLDFFRSAGRAKSPGTMIFTGVMNYFPNVDAVTWFADAVLPRVRDAVPGARFVICGSDPAPRVRDLAARPGIVVTGAVEDTRPYLDEAELFVAPLRLARGIQNKLLEALAMGLPSVASSLCWSATGIPDGEGVIAADDAAEFAARIIDLLRRADHRADMARLARGAVEERYGWELQLRELDRLIDQIAPPVESCEALP